MMYQSSEVTRCLHDTIVALMSFLSTCNFCVMMIWPVSINLSSSFSSFGIGSLRMFVQRTTLPISLDPSRMGRKSPSSSWPPHRLLRCCCELASRVRVLQAEVQVEVLWDFPSGPLLSAFLRLDLVPESVRVFQNPFPRQNSTSSLELQSFHVDSIVLQVVFCELICA